MLSCLIKHTYIQETEKEHAHDLLLIKNKNCDRKSNMSFQIIKHELKKVHVMFVTLNF